MCGLLNPETAARCDCGYDFSTQSLRSSYLQQTKPVRKRPFLVWVIVIFSVFGALSGLAVEVAGLTGNLPNTRETANFLALTPVDHLATTFVTCLSVVGTVALFRLKR